MSNGNGGAATIHPMLVHRKVAILGFRAVGKSSMANSFVKGFFSEAYHPTIESTFHKTVRFRKVHFHTDIVDTAGMVCRLFLFLCVVAIRSCAVLSLTVKFFTPYCRQDEFSRLSRNASLGVHGYVLVFSLGSRQSFNMISHVNDALLTSLGDLPDVPRVLVGTMKDLKEGSRQVSQSDGQRLADTWGVPYIECSSKTGENVAEVFHTMLKTIEKDDFLAESSEGGCAIQ